MFPKKSKTEGGFDSCRFDFRIDTKNGLTPSRRKKIERRTGYNTLFKCKTCGSLFDSRPALLTHKLTHNPVNEWTCPICECQSAGKMTLEQHLRKTHCIGSLPAKKLSGKGVKTAQFNLTPEEIQTMVQKNTEAQTQLNNIKVYDDEIITTRSPPRQTQGANCDQLQRPLLAPVTTTATITSASATPVAPPGMVCVNVPIYIGPQGARPQFIPQNPFAHPANPAAPGMIQVMPNVQGGHFINAFPQSHFTQPKLENDQPVTQDIVKVEPRENIENENITTTCQPISDEINLKPSHNVEVKQEPIDPLVATPHEEFYNLGELNKSDAGNPSEFDLQAEQAANETCLEISDQNSARPTNTPSPPKYEHIIKAREAETLGDTKVTMEEDMTDREGSNSPKLKKPKLGCINMTVEKLWQNRKRTNDGTSPDGATQVDSEVNVSPIVIEPLELEPAKRDATVEDDDYFVPQQEIDPNRLPSAIHLEIKEQYMQYSRGRKRKAKDPYCTAMFHTCRICKQLFDSSEKMWAHLLTHDEMYCKANQEFYCPFCKFSTDSDSHMKQHKLVKHGDEVGENEAPLNLSLPKDTSFNVNDYKLESTKRPDLVSGSRLFTANIAQENETEACVATFGSNDMDENEQIWECDFCDFISGESYQVVKQHMADIHGYYMDVISHRPERDGKTRNVPFVPISVTSSEKGHVITLDPNQVQSQDSPSDLHPDLMSASTKSESSSQMFFKSYPPSGLFGNIKKEVEKSSDMQEESGFFHYSKKQWRHMTQNQTNISIQDAVQSDEPMETTFHMCKICKKLFNTIWDKWEHNYLVHRESHCKLHCPWCNFVSFSRKKLQKHVEVAHPDVNEEDSTPDGKPHVCEICGNTYVSLVHYRLHLLKHREDGPPVFQCPYDACQMKYHTKSGLRNHMKRVHMDSGSEEQRTCPFEGCGKQFSANGMKRHLVCHSEERPVACKYPGCGQSFREVKHLRVHWLQHTDEKPMSCDICDYSCRQRSSMNWHMKSRHGLTKVTGIDGKTTYA